MFCLQSMIISLKGVISAAYKLYAAVHIVIKPEPLLGAEG